MTDDRPGTDRPAGDAADRSRRVQKAFDDLQTALGGRSTPEVQASVEKLRAAVLEQDAPGLRRTLDDVKVQHGWLHSELARHPRIAELVNELALMGL